MRELLIHLFSGRTGAQIARDVIDVLIVAWVVYRALLVLRGTRAIQMAIGLGIVSLVYLGAKALKLATLTSLLSSLLGSIVLIVVVVFQNDIRRALIRMGQTAWFTGGREQQSRVIDEVVAAATELARHRMGALIAFEQDANVLEFAKSEGIHLDCVVTRELLVSLFVPESVNKLHDGAVLIRDLRIARAGVFFPMPDTKILDAQLGSRHRAALGITEETDAVVVVVSEERGTISFCFSGNIVSNLDGQSLRHALLGLFGRSQRKKRPGAKKSPVSTPAPATVRPSPPVTAGGDPPHAARPATTRPSLTSSPSVTIAPQASATTGSTTATLLPRSERSSGSETSVITPTPKVPAAPPVAKILTTSTPMRSASEGRRDADAPPPSGPVSVRPPTFVPTAPKRLEGEAPTEPKDEDA